MRSVKVQECWLGWGLLWWILCCSTYEPKQIKSMAENFEFPAILCGHIFQPKPPSEEPPLFRGEKIQGMSKYGFNCQIHLRMFVISFWSSFRILHISKNLVIKIQFPYPPINCRIFTLHEARDKNHNRFILIFFMNYFLQLEMLHIYVHTTKQPEEHCL